MELLDDGGGDNPVSTKLEEVTEDDVVTDEVEAVQVVAGIELLLSQEPPGGAEEDCPRKLSP